MSRLEEYWRVARLTPLRFITLLGLGLAVSGCGRDATTTPIGTRMPDFTLTDVNPASVTALQPVSPRAYLARASAWYFGHAT